LQFLQARFGLLPLGEVADESREKPLVTRSHFADGQLHGKGRAILALADYNTADADDAALSGQLITVKVAIMALAIWRRHEHLDVFPDGLRCAVAEETLRRAAKRLHGPALVDDDHRLGNRVQDGFEVRLARQCVARHQRGAQPAAME